MLVDRLVAMPWKRFGPGYVAEPVRGDPRLAMVIVNFSTTRYLKLLLLTLAEQEHLGLLHRIVLVDNGSRDGGRELVARLDDRIPAVHAVLRRHRLGHGPGMRAGVRALDRIDGRSDRPANLLLFCDADVVFRSPDVLSALAGTALASEPALVGEIRRAYAEPDIQASFFMVRRDVHARRGVPPLVHDGAPAYRMQRAIFRSGSTVVDLRTNHGGLILHRGRAGIEAAQRYRPRHAYAAVRDAGPHFMGVPDGARIWAEVELRHADLLDPSAEDQLLVVLADRFRQLGTAVLDG